jgi:hypothetical protein
MTREQPTYIREGHNTWHVAHRGGVPGMTLCRRVPVIQWDNRTIERPAPLCKRCAKLS